jgi:hypothetical protein
VWIWLPGADEPVVAGRLDTVGPSEIAVIEAEWDAVCDAARLTEVARTYFRGRQFLNPYALQGYARG